MKILRKPVINRKGECLLAIADTVFHEQKGIGSHQPHIGKDCDGFARIKFMKGKPELVALSELFTATNEEKTKYWNWFNGRSK